MGATTGLSGQVASWAGTFNTALIALLAENQFTLDTDGFDLNTTAFAGGSAIVEAHIKGLKSWRGNIEAMLATPVNGIAGNVSGAAYSTNVRSWDMTITAGVLDATAWPITSSFRNFLPGLVSWGGSYEALVDSATAITEAATSAEPNTATFTISSGNTLAGSIFTMSAQVVSQVGALNVVRYGFRGTGHVTSVGSANLLPAASTLATPVAGSLVLNATGSRTYTGSAFYSSLRIQVPSQGLATVNVGFQGDGALTIA